jgi:hypothetical protein
MKACAAKSGCDVTMQVVSDVNFSSTHPLEAIEVTTWNDYEEGTEIETGIESYAQINASVSGATLSWTVTAAANAPADCTTALAAGFSLEATIHHFEVYSSPAGDEEHLTLLAGDAQPSTTSLDLTGKLPAGAYASSTVFGLPGLRTTTAGNATGCRGSTSSSGGCPAATRARRKSSWNQTFCLSKTARTWRIPGVSLNASKQVGTPPSSPSMPISASSATSAGAGSL